MQTTLRLMALIFFISTTAVSAKEEIMGKLGSPEATRAPDSKVLPAPPLKWGGTIKEKAANSTPWWQPRIAPPKGAPNVLLIMTDDVGYGAPSTFGGTIPTPALDRIAKIGLRYIQFHSTALCSPTRAALITGRNHHTVHSGVVTEMATGYPGYDSLIGKDTVSIGRILKENGYGTAWFGKNHNTPAFQASQAGPFDLWPIGMGFDYFYGFVGGDTSQWQPNLFRNTTAIYPYVGKPDWNLTTAMADEAINWMKQQEEIAPGKPFFVYYVPGGTHAPHHPTPEWIAKFKGKFDHGWNKEREIIFENQKKLGVIPQDAKLTAWPKDLLPEWDSLKPEEKKMFARQAEVYAAYLAYTDHEIGRVIQAVEDMGQLDNTLIIYISGDNGSSAEGTPIGTPNEVASFNGIQQPVDLQLKDYYEKWGSDLTYPHMAVGWTWAFDTPFQWTKQIASHFGGTRQGMAIAWPKVIKDKGGIRSQFHHVIDIVPTILEAVGLPQPTEVDGTKQRPIEGVSMMYTFKKENEKAPTTHKTQYFEMLGNRAIYHDGWVACTTPIKAPWDLTDKVNDDPDAYKWELYHVDKDWTQSNNLAAKEPAKLKELKQLFLKEAGKYNVLPLDASLSQRLLQPRPSLIAGRNDFTYNGEVSGIPHGDAPDILNRSYSIVADIEVPQGGGDGMLVTMGGRFGGYGFYILKGKPVFVHNLVNVERMRWEGKDALTPGKHIVSYEFTYDGGGLGKGGLGVIKVDGKEVARKRVNHTTPFIFQWDETFDVGIDTGTPVDDKDYQVPFRFNGKLNKLTLSLKPLEMMSPADTKTRAIKSQRNNAASE